MAVIFRHAECVMRRHEWQNRRILLRFFYSFLRSRLIFFSGVFLGIYVSEIHPKKTDAPTLKADVPFRPAVFDPRGRRSPGRPYTHTYIYMGCCCIPSVIVVSSRRYPLVVRPCHPAPSIGRLLLHRIRRGSAFESGASSHSTST
jgi:hypothetical protein